MINLQLQLCAFNNLTAKHLHIKRELFKEYRKPMKNKMDMIKNTEVYVYTISHSGIPQEEGDAVNFQLEEERKKEQNENGRNCLTRMRRSPNTATMVLFTVVFLDGMHLTSLGIFILLHKLYT